MSIIVNMIKKIPVTLEVKGPGKDCITDALLNGCVANGLTAF